MLIELLDINDISMSSVYFREASRLDRLLHCRVEALKFLGRFAHLVSIVVLLAPWATVKAQQGPTPTQTRPDDTSPAARLPIVFNQTFAATPKKDDANEKRGQLWPDMNRPIRMPHSHPSVASVSSTASLSVASVVLGASFGLSDR